MGIGLIPAAIDLIGALAAPAADVAADVGVDAAAAGAADLGTAAAAGSTLLPEISVEAAAPALAGAADIGSAVTGAGAAAEGAAGLGDVLGAGALGAGLGGLGSALSSVPGAIGNLFVSPASAAEASTGGGVTSVPKTPAGVAGAAPGPVAGGGGLSGAGASAAGAAAPAGANNVVSGDFGALGYTTPSSPSLPGFPNTSPSGQPLSATATDPTAVVGGSAGSFGGAPLAGLNPPGSAVGDATVNTLGGTASPAFGDFGGTELAGLNPPASGLSGLLSNAGSWVANNPLMAAALGLGGGELINNLFNKPKLPYQAQQEQIASEALGNAGQLQATGTQDLNYQTSGTLPPGLQAQVNQAIQSATAASNSRFASLGLGNSTMATDAINNIKQQALALQGTLSTQLAQTGTQLISDATSDLSVASNVYSGIMQAQISQDNQLEASVTQFAGSLALASAVGGKAGGSGGITLTPGSTITVS